MHINIKRAIIRRVQKGWNMTHAFEKFIQNPTYKGTSYIDFLQVRIKYLRRQVHDWLKWCNMCECEHPYTYEVFWYNWFYSDWTRKLHSTCAAGRLRLKKNINIIKDKRYKWVKIAQKKNYIKNKWNWKKRLISDLSPEDQIIQREKWRVDNAKKYLKKKNGKEKKKL